jgi:PPP family 3-phenylpropionic acid transporter
MLGSAPTLILSARLAFFYGAVFAVLGIYGPFWPVWLEAHGVGAAEIGILFAVATWVKVLGNPLIAHVVDRRGDRRLPMIVLAAAALAAAALFSIADGFWPIFMVTALWGLAFAALIPLAENLTMLKVRAHGLDYGRIRLWGSLTFIAGSVGTGRLLVGRSEDWVLWLILGVLGLVLCATILLPDHKAPPRRQGRAPARLVLGNPLMLVFFAAGGMIQASHAVFYGFSTLHWRAHGHGDDVIGWLWAEGVIVEVALFTFSAAVVRRLGPTTLLIIGGLAAMLRWSVTGLTTELEVLVLVQALHALTFGATHLGAMHFIARAVPAEISATAQSLYAGIAMGVAFGVAMPLAGWLYGQAGGAAFQAMAALAALGTLFAILLARRWRGTTMEMAAA